MTPTRDRVVVGPQLDTGTSTPVAPRPDTWAYAGPPNASDTGIGSQLSARPDVLDSGDAFIPPRWL